MTSSPVFWVALFIGSNVVGTWVGLMCIGAGPVRAARMAPRSALLGFRLLVRMVVRRG